MELSFFFPVTRCQSNSVTRWLQIFSASSYSVRCSSESLLYNLLRPQQTRVSPTRLLRLLRKELRAQTLQLLRVGSLAAGQSAHEE